MSPPKKVVLDANILIRAVLGKKVYGLLRAFEDKVEFYIPDFCVEEAQRNLVRIAEEKKISAADLIAFLAQIVDEFLLLVDHSLYDEFDGQACARFSDRDVDDWPVVAIALLLNAPIWTEDRDFFGTGIATWTTDRIEIYLRDV